MTRFNPPGVAISVALWYYELIIVLNAHTAAQIATVLEDMDDHIITKRNNLITKKGEVDAIDDTDTVTYPTHMDVMNAINAVSFS